LRCNRIRIIDLDLDGVRPIAKIVDSGDDSFGGWPLDAETNVIATCVIY
jgi:hypothetical protein